MSDRALPNWFTRRKPEPSLTYFCGECPFTCKASGDEAERLWREHFAKTEHALKDMGADGEPEPRTGLKEGPRSNRWGVQFAPEGRG